MECSPNTKSLKNIATIGINIAAFLLANKNPLNNATAIIGEKFGANGRNLEAIETTIRTTATRNLMSILLFILPLKK
ncbi:hypothetical protein SDC9_89363 [bioreactor metagenome]|uniref:Uncharacterized protein n=1 Tax=bioreactor metagenome TaxID=1076179 RepID=A0A644ZYR6_9ZZZZ